jgi:hypothetical protein
MIVGFGLMVLGVSREAEIALFGMAFQPHIAKGVGLIGMVVGALGLLAAYGNSLPDPRAERRA